MGYATASEAVCGGDEGILRQLTNNHLFCYLYVYYYPYVGGKRRW